MLHHIEKLVDLFFACVPQPCPSLTSISNARIVAHRGAHDKNIQENTHAAFEQAFNLGCDGIEFDVQTAADGTLVINHDPCLNRLWGQDLSIRSLLFPKLRTLVPLLPSLDEVVVRYGKRMHLFIEIKTPFTSAESLVNTLKPLTPCVDYHLLSLDKELFPSLSMFPKECLLLVPIHNNVGSLCKLSLDEGYGGVLGHYLLLRNRQIKQLKAAHQLVGVGFVDSKFSLYRELNRDLQFLFTNQAALLTACLRELKRVN